MFFVGTDTDVESHMIKVNVDVAPKLAAEIKTDSPMYVSPAHKVIGADIYTDGDTGKKYIVVYVEVNDYYYAMFVCDAVWVNDASKAMIKAMTYLSRHAMWRSGNFGAEWRPDYIRYVKDRKPQRNFTHGSATITLTEVGNDDHTILAELKASDTQDTLTLNSFYMSDTLSLLHEIRQQEGIDEEIY